MSLTSRKLTTTPETAYREGTLKRFAKAIGISECTLGRYRDVYRAWKDISAPGRESLSYAVARELAAHPDRAEIVRDNPDITKREAAKIRRELAPKRNQDGEPTPGDGATTPAEKNNRRVAQQIAKITNELIKAADFARPGVSIEQEQLDDLRARFEPLLPQLKQGREIYSWLIDDLCGKVMPVEPARVAKPASSEDGDEEVNLPTAPRRSHRNGGHDREDEDVRVCSETELAPSEPQDCLTAETAESEAV